MTSSLNEYFFQQNSKSAKTDDRPIINFRPSFQTLRFLEEGSCRTQTKQNILQFMQAVKPFNLTKSECLMMINDPPSSALHIQLQIEDSEERLTEDQVNEIIRIAQQWLTASDEE